jgi:two-component system sensor histidine kinase KdpD
MPGAERAKRWPGYLVGVAVALVSSSLSLVGHRFLSLADAAMLHLLGVVLVATRYGAGPAIVASFIGVAGFDFVLPPTFEFSVADVGHLATLGVMIFVSVLVSWLTEQLRGERQRARRSEQQTLSLYAFERELVTSSSELEQARALIEHLDRALPVASSVLLRSNQELTAIDPSAERPASEDEQQLLARIAADPSSARGQGLFPIAASASPMGVIRVSAAEALLPAECGLIEAFAQRLASAMTRRRLSADAEAARLEAQVERVRAALLSSVSHDLRTPLATISASAHMLVRAHTTVEPSVRGEILAGIADEAERLDALVRNLLAMTRVEAGKLQANLLPTSVDEVVAGALSHLEDRLLQRSVRREAEPRLPLVDVDVPLLEQAFINVLENALRYSPEGTPLTIASRLVGSEVEVVIRDHGLGIDPAETELVFEKFQRGSNVPRADGGVGLGLTICRAVLQAHNGSISLAAAADGGGGTAATIKLPRTRLELGDAERHLPSFA